jgi:hypothetical protein
MTIFISITQYFLLSGGVKFVGVNGLTVCVRWGCAFGPRWKHGSLFLPLRLLVLFFDGKCQRKKFVTFCKGSQDSIIFRTQRNEMRY